MTSRVDDALTGILHPGERLLWSGRSDPSVVFARTDALLIPFSLVWGAFAVFWTTTAAASGAPVFFLLFGGLFCLVGFYLVAGRFVVKAHRKRTTLYAVTDRRALTVAGGSTREVRLPGPDRVTTWSRSRAHVSVVWEPSTTRSLFFGNRTTWPGNSGLDGFVGAATPFAFYDVADGTALAAALAETAR